jgi:hypothetical protein
MSQKHLQMIAHGLILIALMLGLIAAALWLKSGPIENSALAQPRLGSSEGGGIPDTAKQRLEQIQQLEALNQRMAALERGFKDGSFIIQTIDSKAAKQPKE